MGQPIVETAITQHTIWQALTGQLPPLALPALPIGRAVLDSRDAQPGDLFIALKGERTDGHAYVGAALERGACAVICEERAQSQAVEQGAVVLDCTAGRWATTVSLPAGFSPATPLVYIVDSSLVGLQTLGGFQRTHRTRPDLRVIGITGSIGKTSTKELVAAVLRQRYCTHAAQGNLNSEQGLPLAMLALDHSHERSVLEMGMYALGEIETLCKLGRPLIGVVTNVGPVHLERLGSIERIQQAKSELPRSLPAADDGGVAVLNWDDPLVRAMANITKAKIFRYGLSDEADLWADEIQGMGMEGIRFRFQYRNPQQQKIESVHVRVPLLGRHSVHTALRAAAIGIVEGMGWDEIVTGMQSLSAQLRLVVVPGLNRSTVIDDTYNASPASTIAALNLLADVQPMNQGRRIAVLGDMRELGSYSDEGHKLVGHRTADVVDVLLSVGELGRLIAEEALAAGMPAERVICHATDGQAITHLRELLQPHDLVLVKGSRAVGMDEIVAAITLVGEQKSAV